MTATKPGRRFQQRDCNRYIISTKKHGSHHPASYILQATYRTVGRTEMFIRKLSLTDLTPQFFLGIFAYVLHDLPGIVGVWRNKEVQSTPRIFPLKMSNKSFVDIQTLRQITLAVSCGLAPHPLH